MNLDFSSIDVDYISEVIEELGILKEALEFDL